MELVEHIRCPINKYTFQVKGMRDWLLSHIPTNSHILNLYCGPTILSEYKDFKEVRNDLSLEVIADYHLDALACIYQWKEPTFDVIVLDPPYSERKSMEFYGERKASSFMMVKEHIPVVLKPGGSVITFGYHSVSMGRSRGFSVEGIGLFSHGGAIHDTIGTVERLNEN